MARRRGKPKAQVAVGNTQLKVLHKLVSNPGMRYQDLGADYYERRAQSAGRSPTTSASSARSASKSLSAASPHPNPADQGTATPPDPTAPADPGQPVTAKGPLPRAQIRSYFRVSA